jgi:hypothetical protein
VTTVPAEAWVTETGEAIVTETGEPIMTGPELGRYPDAAGLTKGLAYVNPGGSGGIGAFLATTDDQDDLTDQQAQFAAEFAQSVRIR